jgi:RNA polymerase sigma-70 factor (family 1)
MRQGISENEFIGLFNKYFKTLKNYIYYKTGDTELSEDIVQDAFLKLWEKRNEVRLTTAVSLLYTISGNLCKNRFEHQQVVLKFANSYQSSGNQVSPEFEMELKEFDKKLQLTLAALTEKSRVVFLMNRIDGLTYQQIADNLEITVKAVEKRMKKALDFLTEKIEHKL